MRQLTFRQRHFKVLATCTILFWLICPLRGSGYSYESLKTDSNPDRYEYNFHTHGPQIYLDENTPAGEHRMRIPAGYKAGQMAYNDDLGDFSCGIPPNCDSFCCENAAQYLEVCNPPNSGDMTCEFRGVDYQIIETNQNPAHCTGTGPWVEFPLVEKKGTYEIHCTGDYDGRQVDIIPTNTSYTGEKMIGLKITRVSHAFGNLRASWYN